MVVLMMSDDQLKQMGLEKYGDRIALCSLCEGMTSSSYTNNETNTILQRINSSLSNTGTKRRQMKLLGNKNAKKEKRRIEIGWLTVHEEHLRQIKQKQGGGTRSLTEDVSITVADILEKAKMLFFPDGKSVRGTIENFKCSIVKFDGSDIAMQTTVKELMKAQR